MSNVDDRSLRPRERDLTPAIPEGRRGDPGGDAILGAALEGLRRAAEEVEVERSTAETLQRSLLRQQLPSSRDCARGALPPR